jgi:hypothetical protein
MTALASRFWPQTVGRPNLVHLDWMRCQFAVGMWSIVPLPLTGSAPRGFYRLYALWRVLRLFHGCLPRIGVRSH